MNLALCFDTYTQSCMMIHSIAGSCCQSQHWGGRILRTKGPEFSKSWEAFTKARNTFLLIACTVAPKSTKKRNDKLKQRPFPSWLLRCVKWYVLVEATNKISNLKPVWPCQKKPFEPFEADGVWPSQRFEKLNAKGFKVMWHKRSQRHIVSFLAITVSLGKLTNMQIAINGKHEAGWNYSQVA